MSTDGAEMALSTGQAGNSFSALWYFQSTIVYFVEDVHILKEFCHSVSLVIFKVM